MMNHNRKPVWPEDTPLPTVDPKVDPNMIMQTRRYKLITPLFGGGVEPQKADPITVVRANEVRGHLRFWWRATRGGQFDGDLEKMRKAEEAIWGSAAGKDKPGPSEVKVIVGNVKDNGILSKVTIQTRHGPESVDVGDPQSPYGYIAFPLRKDERKPAGNLYEEGIEFTLTLSYPRALEPEIAPALWAWETFGGIGARTRRGFGALQLIEVGGVRVSAPASAEAQKQLDQNLKIHVVDGQWPPSVPHLSQTINRRVFQYDANTSATDVWLDLITALAQFRQAPKGRPKGTQATNWRPGRSYWPEPDEIRRRMGTHKPGHAPSHPVRKFPRAAFGLPIIFEFKRGDVPPEPQKTTLQGAEHDRLASPLILRPIACANGQAVGLAAVLEAPIKPPGGWLLKGAPGSPTHPPIEARLTSTSEANAIKPLKDVGGETNVLLAFLKSL